jgi:4-amino-4-deoxy-L-arabinose transferase-like glycosyltransferase
MAFGLGTAWLLFHFLRRRFNDSLALVGVLLFLSTPIILRLSITAYVDLGLVFFSFAAVYALCRWIDTGCQTRWLVLAAVFCGLALSTKYNGLITLFILTCSVPLLFLRQGPRTKGKQLKAVCFASLFLAVSLSVFSPWMIRNLQMKGNPVYPLFNSLFLDQDEQADCARTPGSAYWECQPRYGSFLKRKLLYNEAWWETALIPFRIFFQGQDHEARLFDGRLNPLLFFLPLAAFVIPRKHKGAAPLAQEKYFFLCFSLLFVLSVFLQRDMRIRYAAPMIPPLVILSVCGLERILSWLAPDKKTATDKADSSRVAKTMANEAGSSPKIQALLAVAALICLGCLLSLNVSYLGKQFQRVQPVSYLSGQVSREAYILKRRPEFAVYQFANQHLRDEARILGLFLGNRRYYLHRRMYCNITYFQNIVATAESPGHIASTMREDGITHLILSFRLFTTWLDESSPAEKHGIIQAFFSRYTTRLKAARGFGLFAIRADKSQALLEHWHDEKP